MKYALVGLLAVAVCLCFVIIVIVCIDLIREHRKENDMTDKEYEYDPTAFALKDADGTVFLNEPLIPLLQSEAGSEDGNAYYCLQNCEECPYAKGCSARK